jgi:NAD(P)-dependent dehydrogenase (short-subunit alcohol dehydrogenase family)
MIIAKYQDLCGRTALVTGASGGLGNAICDAYASLGLQILMVDKELSSLEKRKLDILKKYPKTDIQNYRCDLSSNRDRSNLIDELKMKFNKIHILVNNAAFVGSSRRKGWNESFLNQDVGIWSEVFEINVTSIFHLCQGLNGLLNNANGVGSVINISSMYANRRPEWSLYKETSISNPAAYSASKAAVNQLTAWLASVMAPHVRVNAISPGGIERGQDANFIRAYEDKVLLGRMAREEDIIGMIAYLSSDLSSYVTAQNFCIEGGF